MDMGEGGGHAPSGPSSGVISSMQGQGGGGGGGAPGTELSFGVEGNIIAGLDGTDPKGGTPLSILTFGFNSVMGIKFDFGLFETTQCISGGFWTADRTKCYRLAKFRLWSNWRQQGKRLII